jgi:Domain of unknown function DUF11
VRDRRRSRIIASFASLALLTAALIAPGTAAAKTPGWTMTVTPLPGTVSAGAAAGYRVVITNGGKSNIAKLYLTDDRPETPAAATASQGSCGTDAVTGELSCNLGALRSGKSVTVTVAYMTSGASPFNVTFEANTSGVSFSDGGTSHGDALRASAATILSTSPNFAGRFTLNTSIIKTNDQLGTGNIQSTAIVPPTSGIGVAIEDGPGIIGTSCAGVTTAIGEWSSLDVAGGQTFDQPGFKVTLFIQAASLPAGFQLSNVVVCHDTGTGSQKISAACDPSTGIPTNAECLTATLHGTLGVCHHDDDDGYDHYDHYDRHHHDDDDHDYCTPASGYLQIDVWLLHNGKIGGFI